MEDGHIFCAARIALDRCPTVPPSVHVHVHGGTVILTGSVRFPSERADAEAAVRHVDGVRHLVNRIAVSPIPSPAGFEAPPRSE
jgi:osmotically-inducible protein OsmY